VFLGDEKIRLTLSLNNEKKKMLKMLLLKMHKMLKNVVANDVRENDDQVQTEGGENTRRGG